LKFMLVSQSWKVSCHFVFILNLILFLLIVIYFGFFIFFFQFHPSKFGFIKFLYHIWSSFFWLQFILFWILFLIDFFFQFHPSTFDFMLVLYQIWFSLFWFYFFYFGSCFWMIFFFIPSQVFGWLVIWLHNFFRFVFMIWVMGLKD
jgi:hypothetical protein